MKLVVMGGSGWLGRAVVDRLWQSGHTGSVADIHPAPHTLPGGWKWVKCDVTDPIEVGSALAGAEGVIHLAVATDQGDYDDPKKPFTVNVVGCYNVLEAVRRCGVQRVVLMSSAPVHLDPDRGSAAEWRSDTGADHLHDVTKRLQEELARDFSETFGVSIAILRAGHIVDSRAGQDPKGRVLTELAYCRGGWVCRYDVAEAVSRAAEGTMNGTFTVVGSRQGRERFNVAQTEKLLGFRLAADFAEYD